MAYIVEFEKVKKRYGRTLILDDISVSLERGKIYGLLGANGAGKTTMLRVITGLIPNYSGVLRIWGNSNLNEGRRIIGSTIENPILFENLTALGNLEMYGSAANIERKELESLLAVVGLENNKKAVRKFSLGMKQKLALAVALLGKPEFIVLDEPTNGLDPIAIKELRNLIVKLNTEQGVSFLVSSHDVNELVKVADYFLIMQSGKIKCEMDKQTLITAAKNEHAGMEDYIVGLMEKTNG